MEVKLKSALTQTVNSYAKTFSDQNKRVQSRRTTAAILKQER